MLTHDIENYAAKKLNTNGSHSESVFVIRMVHGYKIKRNSNWHKLWSCVDYFLSMFPQKQMELMVKLTNQKLKENKRDPMTTGEILWFIGVNIIISGFELSACNVLCTITSNTNK